MFIKSIPYHGISSDGVRFYDWYPTLVKIREVLEMTIEEKIRAKKEEIKRVNRELSKLQDEARNKNNPVKVRFYNATYATGITDRSEYPIMYSVDFMANREVDSQKIIKAIESLSESSEPNGYVDWDKIDKKYNWVATDSDGQVWGYGDKPIIGDGMWRYNGRWETFGLLQYHGTRDKS